MGKYTGCECMICQKQFTEQEDIVVCPDCGTPYHRSCYQSAGRCINTSLHAVGGSYQSVQNEYRRQHGGIECAHCGYVNLPDAQTCSACDLPLTSSEKSDSPQNPDRTVSTPDGQQYYFQASDPYCGMSPDYDMDGERLDDVADFVQTNTLYYIPLFRRFKETDRKLSFNLPCVLFPYLYFANRKMWLMTILSGLICFICSLPDFFLNMLANLQNANYFQMMESSGINTENVFNFLTANQALLENLQTPLFIVKTALQISLCLFGNYLYFRFVLKSVKRIRKHSPNPSMKKALLTAEGGTSFWNIIGCFGLYFGIMSLILTIVSG